MRADGRADGRAGGRTDIFYSTNNKDSEHPGADPAPHDPQNHTKSYFYWFVRDFGSIFEEFGRCWINFYKEPTEYHDQDNIQKTYKHNKYNACNKNYTRGQWTSTHAFSIPFISKLSNPPTHFLCDGASGVYLHRPRPLLPHPSMIAIMMITTIITSKPDIDGHGTDQDGANDDNENQKQFENPTRPAPIPTQRTTRKLITSNDADQKSI